MEIIYMLNDMDCKKCKYFVICEEIKKEIELNSVMFVETFIKTYCYYYVNQDNNYPRKEDK